MYEHVITNLLSEGDCMLLRCSLIALLAHMRATSCVDRRDCASFNALHMNAVCITLNILFLDFFFCSLDEIEVIICGDAGISSTPKWMF